MDDIELTKTEHGQNPVYVAQNKTDCFKGRVALQIYENRQHRHYSALKSPALKETSTKS